MTEFAWAPVVPYTVMRRGDDIVDFECFWFGDVWKEDRMN